MDEDIESVGTIEEHECSSYGEPSTVPLEPSLDVQNDIPQVLTKSTTTFHCCFGIVHVYTVSKCLLVYHFLLLTFIVVIFFRESAQLLLSMYVLFAATGWALFRAYEEWLWPFIIYTTCSTLMFILFSAYLFFYSMLKSDKTVEDIVMSTVTSEEAQTSYLLPFLLHALNLLLCVFHFWQVVILLSTRKFLKRLKIVKKEQLFRQDSISVQTTTSNDQQ